MTRRHSRMTQDNRPNVMEKGPAIIQSVPPLTYFLTIQASGETAMEMGTETTVTMHSQEMERNGTIPMGMDTETT